MNLCQKRKAIVIKEKMSGWWKKKVKVICLSWSKMSLSKPLRPPTPPPYLLCRGWIEPSSSERVVVLSSAASMSGGSIFSSSITTRAISA